MTETRRLFVAVEVPDAVRSRVAAASIRARVIAPQAKWVEPSAMHLTLVFLGDVDAARVPDHAEALAAAASSHARFALRIAAAGTMGGRRPRVLWAGVSGEVAALAALQRDLTASILPLGFVPEERAFVPHLTLARARAPRGEPRFDACVELLAAEDFGEIAVDRAILFASQLGPRGALHTPLAELSLARG